MLAHRGTEKGESQYSWTVDFADKRKQARAEMQPLLDEAAEVRAAIVDLKEQLRDLKRASGPALKFEALETEIAEKQKALRSLKTRPLKSMPPPLA